MLERVDIDEKWFYMTEVATSYILVPGETPPHQTCKQQESHQKGYVSHCSGMTATESPEWRMVGRKDRHLFIC